MDRTIVSIGCSSDADYNFPLPITCLLWSEVVGYRPLVMLVGSDEEWRQSRRLAVALEALLHLGFPPVFLGRIEGYPDGTLAQSCRQHAAALSWIGDNDWLMPADADLWPLRRQFYHQHEGTKHRAVLYYGNGDHFGGKAATLERAAAGLRSQTIPTCHATMRARDWRAIYRPIAGDIAASVKQSLDAWLPTKSNDPDPNMTLWMADQQLLTDALCQQPWFPDTRLDDRNEFGAIKATTLDQSVLFITRRGHPPVDRLCRSDRNWPPFDVQHGWTDAHIFKAPDSEEPWSHEVQLIDALLPKHSEWARSYRSAYAEARDS